MKLLATGILVSGILTIVFWSMVFADDRTLMSSPLAMGDMPAYGLLILGLFGIDAGCLLLEDIRHARGVKRIGAGESNENPSTSNSEPRTRSSDPVQVGQAEQVIQMEQRPKIHVEILTQLHLEYGTKRFKTRDAVKVAGDRLNADAPSARFAIHWGQTQGKIVMVGHGIYQFVETAPVMISLEAHVVNNTGSQNEKSVMKGQNGKSAAV